MNSLNEDEVDVAIAAMFIGVVVLATQEQSAKRQRKKRRWSVRPINWQRKEKGHFHNLFKEMKLIDAEQFFKYTRMRREHFDKILRLISPKLLKRSRREPLSPEHRLAITLYYLAHGCSMQVVAWSFYVGKSTVSVVVRETCQAIWDILSPIYLKKPNVDEWYKIAECFSQRWQMPHCCGAIDGKHVVIQAPKKSGTAFFNYKKTFSIVLMATCDDNYRFILVDIGSFGSQSDGGVFASSTFGQNLDSGSIKFPDPSILPNSDIEFPYFLVGDEAFPLKSYLLRPFPGSNLELKKKIYNYRLSRARRTIENAFGILTSRWRIFRHTIIAEVDTVEKIVAATICLHNFLKTKEMELPANQRLYCPNDFCDGIDPHGNIIEGNWRNDRTISTLQRMGRVGANYSTRSMVNMRNVLADYFCSPEGAVPWQVAHVQRGSRPN